MIIGIIIYSQTGNTREVARRLQEKLAEKGHRAEIDEISINGKVPAQPGGFELSGLPDPGQYDAVVFGSPVQAFNLNPVMRAYLDQVPMMEGKEAACFITKQLPIKWTGGTRALGLIKNACEAKGAVVKGAEIIFWTERKRRESIARAVENLAALF